MRLPLWVIAGWRGFFAGAALVVGAEVGYFVRVPQRIIAGVMDFGSGVLISALSFVRMDEASKRGGFDSTATGFHAGELGAGSSWRETPQTLRGQQPSESESSGSGLAIALGALLDGVPEYIVIGLSMLQGGAVSTVAVISGLASLTGFSVFSHFSPDVIAGTAAVAAGAILARRWHEPRGTMLQRRRSRAL